MFFFFFSSFCHLFCFLLFVYYFYTCNIFFIYKSPPFFYYIFFPLLLFALFHLFSAFLPFFLLLFSFSSSCRMLLQTHSFPYILLSPYIFFFFPLLPLISMPFIVSSSPPNDINLLHRFYFLTFPFLSLLCPFTSYIFTLSICFPSPYLLFALLPHGPPFPALLRVVLT